MAEPDQVYTDMCDALKAMAQGEYRALTEAAPVQDQGLRLEQADLTPEELARVCSREQINEQYRKLMDTGGATPAEMHAAQMQAAVLGALEKAMRARFRTRVQSLVCGASRAYGQGQDTGYFGRVLPIIPLQMGS
jgi:hypothetical protein